jgi:hypothetical protein
MISVGVMLAINATNAEPRSKLYNFTSVSGRRRRRPPPRGAKALRE